MAQRITVTKTDYSWGTLRTVAKGNQYSVVIHPEHWAHLAAQTGEWPEADFTDEQGITWTVIPTWDGGVPSKLRFRSGRRSVTVDFDELV